MLWDSEVRVAAKDSGASGTPLPMLVLAGISIGVVAVLLNPGVGLVLLGLIFLVACGCAVGTPRPQRGRDWRDG